MTVAGVIYGTESGICRRIAYADNVDRLAPAVRCVEGETLIIVRLDQMPLDERQLPTLAAAQALIDDARGAPAETARCAVFDDATGDIVSVIQADPMLDKPAGQTLWQNDDVGIGWVADANGVFIDPNDAEGGQNVD